ncbi:FxsB family cyclophane-forming radical SAM/SPASM peptide maturase [Nonomuraea sp. NPDC050310]|uniref:FxsB family cyclophane-forming radical SAM/SPASM peptide maturase n=1 Tax=Nonomuraea sp. NPDC050310 TaxID=3154935 RepID=UPI0033E30F16
MTDGWRPTPFRQFILKIHSRCDLACAYCYVYEQADQSWRGRPKRMSHDVAKLTSARIAEHVLTHDLDSVEIILHGGEPLLAGPDSIGELVRLLRAEIPARVDVVTQTNGTLLTERFLDLFAELDLGVGVSLDGTAEAHDRWRRTADGRGSHHKVAAALERLGSPAYRHLFRGLLCAVDTANDPIETYEALLAFDPPTIDFLLPHATWADPPVRAAATPYADWLIEIFTRWYGTRPAGVRLFDEILLLLLGGASATEQVGLSPAAMVVVETDGEIEQSDILKVAYAGAPGTGLHVRDDSFDEALRRPGVVARQLGRLALAEQCTNCPVGRVCGGGHYAHRYRPGSGFRNPSVYCPDLLRLITHIGDTVRADLKEPR